MAAYTQTRKKRNPIPQGPGVMGGVTPAPAQGPGEGVMSGVTPATAPAVPQQLGGAGAAPAPLGGQVSPVMSQPVGDEWKKQMRTMSAIRARRSVGIVGRLPQNQQQAAYAQGRINELHELRNQQLRSAQGAEIAGQLGPTGDVEDMILRNPLADRNLQIEALKLKSQRQKNEFNQEVAARERQNKIDDAKALARSKVEIQNLNNDAGFRRVEETLNAKDLISRREAETDLLIQELKSGVNREELRLEAYELANKRWGKSSTVLLDMIRDMDSTYSGHPSNAQATLYIASGQLNPSFVATDLNQLPEVPVGGLAAILHPGEGFSFVVSLGNGDFEFLTDAPTQAAGATSAEPGATPVPVDRQPSNAAPPPDRVADEPATTPLGTHMYGGAGDPYGFGSVASGSNRGVPEVTPPPAKVDAAGTPPNEQKKINMAIDGLAGLGDKAFETVESILDGLGDIATEMIPGGKLTLWGLLSRAKRRRQEKKEAEQKAVQAEQDRKDDEDTAAMLRIRAARAAEFTKRPRLTATGS